MIPQGNFHGKSILEEGPGNRSAPSESFFHTPEARDITFRLGHLRMLQGLNRASQFLKFGNKQIKMLVALGLCILKFPDPFKDGP